MSSNDPNSTPDDDFYVGLIDNNTRVAFQLGLYVANFAALEATLVYILSLALNDDEDAPKANVICGRVRNISDRCQIVKDCVLKSEMDPQKRDQAAGFIDEILGANAKRNEYVHGMWEGTADGSVRLTPFATTIGRIKPSRPISESEIKADTLKLRRLVSRISSALFPEKIQTVSPDS